MTVPFRTFALLGIAVGTLGAGYLFIPQPGATTLPQQSIVKAAAAAPAAPVSKAATTLVASRPPVPLVTRTHTTYFANQEPGTAGQGIVMGSPPTADVQTASVIIGVPAADGGTLPTTTDASAKRDNDSQAKAAIELDGYKNVRNLEKGADGVWRGRAMRGRTEITITVDASGSVSAE